MTPLQEGKLLIASPLLLDPQFYQTIIFLISHKQEGSFGLVLNKPHEFTLGQGLESGCPDNLKNHPLFLGGPVDPQSFFCLHNNGFIENGDSQQLTSNTGNFKNIYEIIPGVYLGAEDSVLDAYAFENPDNYFKVKFFNGYSGWTQGQLDSEIKEGSWIIREATPSIIFDNKSTNQWEGLMSDSNPSTTVDHNHWNRSQFN